MAKENLKEKSEDKTKEEEKNKKSSKDEKSSKAEEKNKKSSKEEKNSSKSKEKNKKASKDKSSEDLESEDQSSKDELAKLNDDLKAKDEVISELKSHIQRLQADFDNFRKQTEKHNKDLVAFANEGLILKFIDIYEDMGRVLENSKTEEDLSEGFKLIHSKMQNTFEKEGVKEIPSVGEKFDPFVHEAQGTLNSPNHEDKEIVAEIMKGYTLKDKIIKNPIVIVCKK